MNSLIVAQQAAGGFNPSILLMVGLFAVLIIMMLRGKKKMAKQQETLKSKTVPGARVMTNSGIFGTVVDINDAENIVRVQVADGVILSFHRQAISQFLSEPENASAADKSIESPDETVRGESSEETLRRLNGEGKNDNQA